MHTGLDAMKHRTLRGLLAGAVLAFCALEAAPAGAASVTYLLDQSNLGAFPDGTPRLSVTISDDASDGSVDFRVETIADAFNEGPNFGIQSFGFNVTGGIGRVRDWNVIGLPDDWDVNRNTRMDGFGRFDVVLEGGRNDRVDPLEFSIVGIAADTIANYFDQSSGSAGQGHEAFAARVGGFSLVTLTRVGGERERHLPTSGYFAGSTAAPVPLPAAGWLLLSGLAGLGAFARRRRREGGPVQAALA